VAADPGAAVRPVEVRLRPWDAAGECAPALVVLADNDGRQLAPHGLDDCSSLPTVDVRSADRNSLGGSGETRDTRRSALETMIGIAAILVGAGVLWLCFALGVYFFTRTGREGLRIQRMEDERRQRVPPEG
jgi:hypothetical protein